MLNLLDIDERKKIKEVNVTSIIDTVSTFRENFTPSDCIQSSPNILISAQYGFDGLKNISRITVYKKWNPNTPLENRLTVISFDVKSGDKISIDNNNGKKTKNGTDNNMFIYFFLFVFEGLFFLRTALFSERRIYNLFIVITEYIPLLLTQ